MLEKVERDPGFTCGIGLTPEFRHFKGVTPCHLPCLVDIHRHIYETHTHMLVNTICAIRLYAEADHVVK